jgi:hypothetical protein
MSESAAELARRLREEERDWIRDISPPPQRERPTLHYTELADALPDSPIVTEWNYYRREVARLLSEGHEGKWVLIKHEKIIGIWDTWEEAYQTAIRDYLMQHVLIQQVRTREPILRGGGRGRQWRV